MGEPFRLGIIVGDFHRELAETMVASAQAEAARLQAEVTSVIRVPGSYEIPLVADALMARSGVDALVVLGYIEKGETLHGEVMGHAVHSALIQLQLTHKKPIGIGIIGPGATREQAELRKVSYAAAAVAAALRSLEALGWQRGSRSPLLGYKRKARGLCSKAAPPTSMPNPPSWLPPSQIAEQLLHVSGALVAVVKGARFRYLSPAWRDCTGYSLDELCTRPLCDFLHPEDVARAIKCRVDGVVPDGFETRFICKDGGLRWLSWRGTHQPESDVFHGIALDVTDYRRTQQRLQEAQTLARLGHWEYDVRTGVSLLSEGMRTLYNLPPGKTELSQEDARSLLPPETYEDLVQRSAQAATIKATVEARTTRAMDDGTTRHYLVRTTPEFGPRGELTRFWGTVQDITEDVVREADLQKARESAEQASRMKSQFLANTSHEIRTPLNAILNANELLLLTPLDAEQRELVELALLSGRGLLGLLNSVLDLARIEAGKVELEQAPFEPSRVLEELINSQKNRAFDRQIDLKLVLDPGAPARVQGDELRLRQIVGNLLDNALKFTERGYIELGLKSAELGGLLLWVKDTGGGIPAEKLKQIFEPFTQADASNTRLHGGVGLGLTICREFVALMGGTLDVESSPAAGTTFRVWLPLPLLPPRVPSQPHIEAVQGTTRPLRILVAEDNDFNAKVLLRWLKKQGHSAEVASDGRKAVELGLRGPWDLLLMDLQMPHLDGIEATRQLRARLPDDQRLPIVALTANAQHGEADRCRAAGMDDYLTKPVPFERLAMLLASIGSGEFGHPQG